LKVARKSNFARYQVRPTEFAAWAEVWNAGIKADWIPEVSLRSILE